MKAYTSLGSTKKRGFEEWIELLRCERRGSESYGKATAARSKQTNTGDAFSVSETSREEWHPFEHLVTHRPCEAPVSVPLSFSAGLGSLAKIVIFVVLYTYNQQNTSINIHRYIRVYIYIYI